MNTNAALTLAYEAHNHRDFWREKVWYYATLNICEGGVCFIAATSLAFLMNAINFGLATAGVFNMLIGLFGALELRNVPSHEYPINNTGKISRFLELGWLHAMVIASYMFGTYQLGTSWVGVVLCLFTLLNAFTFLIGFSSVLCCEHDTQFDILDNSLAHMENGMVRDLRYEQSTPHDFISEQLYHRGRIMSRTRRASAMSDCHECGICLSQFAYRQTTARFPCGHRFHEQCIRGWLCRLSTEEQTGNRRCPSCRTASTRRSYTACILPPPQSTLQIRPSEQ